MPNFKMSLFFGSLQKDSNLPPQDGDYLRDSFRTSVIGPFAQAVVSTLAAHEKKMSATDHENLIFQLTIGGGLVAVMFAVMISVLKSKGARRPANQNVAIE